MAKYTINSIGGISQTYFSEGYLGSCAIDPDEKINGRIGGVISPVNTEIVSGVSGAMWFAENDKDDNTYYYTKDGDFGYIDENYGVSAISAFTASGNGLEYYNNYYYIATGTDIHRFGPLETPAVELNWWSGRASLDKLGDTSYPQIGVYNIPNHHLHIHGDGTLYLTDFQNNQGRIHRLKTVDLIQLSDVTEVFIMGEIITGETSKASSTIMGVDGVYLKVINTIGTFTLNENVTGTTQGIAKFIKYTEGSAPILEEMDALILPPKYQPISIESFGTDLGIIAIKNQAEASIFLWDTFADSFYRQILLPYEKVSAVKNHNGIPYIFGGDDDGYSVSIYTGGNTVEQIRYIDNGLMPLQGAIDTSFNRLKWGSKQDYPETRGCVWSLGSKTGHAGLHNIASAGTQVAALKGNLMGHANGFSKRGGLYDSIWRSEPLSFGRPFDLEEVVIPLGADLGASDTITVTFYYDNEDSNNSFVIDSTTYADRIIKLHPEAQGVQNAFIEVKIESVNQIHIFFPITISYKIYD